MKKLLAGMVLTSIPIGICVLLIGAGGWQALLFFVGLIIGLCVLVVAAAWAVEVIFDQ